MEILTREELKGLVATGKNLDNVILKAGSGIKPCPFCGETAAIMADIEVVEDDGVIWLPCIRCEYCGIRVIIDEKDPVTVYNDRKEAGDEQQTKGGHDGKMCREYRD